MPTSVPAGARVPGRRRPVSPEPTLRHLVANAERLLRQGMADRLATLGLTVSGYTALFVLRREPGISNAALARYLGVKPQATNQILQQLLADGLVQRVASEADGRVLLARLTPRGESAIARCEADGVEVEASVFTDLDPREREELVRLLDKAVGEFGGRAARPEPPAG